eukprot:15351383-Ditylum_brightwellii.AAC.1
MSEESDGPVPQVVSSSGEGGGNASKPHKKKKKNQANYIPCDPVKGETEELKDHVFNTGPNSKNQFATTTRAISEYMMRTNKNAGEFISAFNPDNLGFSRIPYPANCDENAS